MAAVNRAQQAGRLGLINMRERATLAGGALEIESSDKGTSVFVRVPVGEPLQPGGRVREQSPG